MTRKKVIKATGAKVDVPEVKKVVPQPKPPPPPVNEKGDKLIQGLVIHTAASTNPKHDNAATVDIWHKRRGWTGIGYHWYIRRDGKLETGRPIDNDPYLESDEVGAHVLGENRNRLGVCLGGNGDPTEAQLERLGKLFEDEILTKNPNADLTGHNHYTNKKTCPNFFWRRWVKDFYPKALPVEKG